MVCIIPSTPNIVYHKLITNSSDPHPFLCTLQKPLVLEVGIRFSALKQALFQLQDLYNDVASFAFPDTLNPYLF
jgi:hypothetical protein